MHNCAHIRRSMPMPKATVATITSGSPERKRSRAARFSTGDNPA